MQMPATLSADKQNVEVVIPCTRSDVLHKCDIMEDIAIAYGFNNIKRTIPNTVTVAKQQPLNHLSDLLRNEMAQAGYTEILTFGLCSGEEQFDHMNIPDTGDVAVTVGNPASRDFEMVRISLIPGLLKTLKSSSALAPPFKLFECSDVVLLDGREDVGARNERRMCSVYCGQTSGFEFTHGVVDRLMLLNRVEQVPMDQAKEGKETYSIVAAEHPSFFPGRCAQIFVGKKAVGYFGIIHPRTLGGFGITLPVSAMEMEIEVFL